MQYILSEEEYSKLLLKIKEKANLPSKEKLQEFCTEISNTLVLTDGWRKGHTWNCIITEDYEWYCDDCPSQKICPSERKMWSK